MKLFLLRCKRMICRHIGENIALEYESTIEEYGIQDKCFRAVTDNASNMCKAFSIEVLSDEDENETIMEDDVDSGNLDETKTLDFEPLECSSRYERRIGCFAHSSIN